MNHHLLREEKPNPRVYPSAEMSVAEAHDEQLLAKLKWLCSPEAFTQFHWQLEYLRRLSANEEAEALGE
jgi:hypothetical protein